MLLRLFHHNVASFLTLMAVESEKKRGHMAGSDIHVMLVLCYRSRQVVVAEKPLDGTARLGALLGQRQRLTDPA